MNDFSHFFFRNFKASFIEIWIFSKYRKSSIRAIIPEWKNSQRFEMQYAAFFVVLWTTYILVALFFLMLIFSIGNKTSIFYEYFKPEFLLKNSSNISFGMECMKEFQQPLIGITRSILSICRARDVRKKREAALCR